MNGAQFLAQSGPASAGTTSSHGTNAARHASRGFLGGPDTASDLWRVILGVDLLVLLAIGGSRGFIAARRRLAGRAYYRESMSSGWAP
jgi:hypothetical protein